MGSTTDVVGDARLFLRNRLTWTADEIVAAAGELMRQGQFPLSRRLLEEYHAGVTLDPSREVTLLPPTEVQRLRAYVTYRDPDLPATERFDRALSILTEHCGLGGPTLPRASVVMVAGTVYLARWRIFGRQRDLQEALEVFEAALEVYGKPDANEPLAGPLATRCAFVYDLLAQSEVTASRRHGHSQQAARRLRELAVSLKPASLPESQRDVAHVIAWAQAEARFGLGRTHDDEGDESPWYWFRTAVSFLDGYVWVVYVQLPDLIRVAEVHQLVGWQDQLAESLGVPRLAIDHGALGQTGVALSGGGLRASLFHLGLLASLAERGMLGRVEVLSCVSGGSIVGMYYYLWLRKLLEAKPDEQITDQDWVTLVKVVQEHFVAAVQGNLRMKMLGQGRRNLRATVAGEFDTSVRFGETVEASFYDPIETLWLKEAHRFGVQPGPKRPPPRMMDELTITPAGADAFEGRLGNLGRINKVPALIINATTMNTGHDWQFTVTYAGEPPRPIPVALDILPRLRRFYYIDRTGAREPMRISIGRAVAASACIPGLFPPARMPKWFEDYDLTLGDGGVHDNQGIGGLLERGCTQLIISDASGQSKARENADDGVLGGAMAANGILQQRIRELQFEDLVSRQQAGLIRGFLLVHLTQGLVSAPKDWVNCEDPAWRRGGYVEQIFRETRSTPAGLRPATLHALSELRTDMDVHSDIEAYGLMAAAYHQGVAALSHAAETLPLPQRAEGGDWAFRVMDPFVLADPQTSLRALDQVLLQLRRGRHRMGRMNPSAEAPEQASNPADIGNTLWGVIAVVFGWLPARISLGWATPRLLAAGKVPKAR
jgi:predicted acylesterase/phospholipase RssA